MIKSGLVQKMMPSQPVAEDEEKELGALDIVEETVLRVVNLADQVAARGRQLNHRLRGRRTAIQDRRAADGRANGSNGWTPHNPSSTSSQVRQEVSFNTHLVYYVHIIPFERYVDNWNRLVATIVSYAAYALSV